MSELRNTTQYLLPVTKQPQPGYYDPYPVHDLGPGKIHCGYDTLAERLIGHKMVVIDGYIGIRFDDFARRLGDALAAKGVKPLWWRTSAAMKPEAEIDALIEPFLGGDDPLFGYRCPLTLDGLFDMDKMRDIKPDPSAEMNILIGAGASLAHWDDAELVYLDLPKNELQFRARSGGIRNLGASHAAPPKKMYKRFYFIDWVMLNRHKKAILSDIDIYVDGQREEIATWADGSEIRTGLECLARNGFRVRPWFEPGAWGGQWIREHIPALPHDVKNYAWSFELIVPENGIIFGSDNNMLEVSFDTVMFQNGANVVGQKCYAVYGDEFPIRMDYLDNFSGGNLSIQCHPRRSYIQKNFGEVLTQEETYYILDTTPGAVVYLGFQPDIEPEKFRAALTESFEKGTPLDVPRYINSEPSEKHGLYLIPPGTLHSSGRNNLVLEISTTPYIFTFKMYDWLSLDLDGKPRPLNISRAMDNLYFDRKGEKVREEFVSKPVLLERGSDWELWHLPTHPNHSYDVHRYKVNSEVEVQTEGRCHVLNLVEGETAEVVTYEGQRFHLNYAETLVISAAAGSYRIINTSGREIMMVKAFMK